MALLVGVVLALGLDDLAEWVLRGLVAFVLVGLVVALVVVQTVAIVLTGANATPPAGTGANAAREVAAPITIPVPVAATQGEVDLGKRIIGLAETWLGVPYVFDGCSRAGVDCSCLVQNVYAAVGIRLPRVAVDQFNATTPTGDPRPGDLVFFANTYQPGIRMSASTSETGLQINAPTTGEVVSVAPVLTGYWGAHYAGAHRVGRIMSNMPG
jgi:cell wall-associated NlpC family hydrolase